MSLSPWDLGGLGLSFGLYRPRRPSYTIATQSSRQRTESYRHATRRDNSSSEITAKDQDFVDDFLEDVHQKQRKESYVRATRQEIFELTDTCIPPDSENFTPIPKELLENNIVSPVAIKFEKSLANSDSSVFHEQTPCDSDQDGVTKVGTKRPWKYSKNLILLCISFILTFSSFRAIQNLQTSLNPTDQLGLLSVSCIHGTMVLTSAFVPIVINKLRAKLSLALGMFFHLAWISANFYPRFYTLIPTAVLAGFGQGILWTGEVSYIIKLALDSSKISARPDCESEVFRFHGIFVACFQTTHMWGNLLSSLILKAPSPDQNKGDNFTSFSPQLPPEPCGILHPCVDTTALFLELFPGGEGGGVPLLPIAPPTEETYTELWQLMSAYLIMAGVGFLLLLFCLDGIGAQIDPAKSYSQLIVDHLTFMFRHKTYRLLVPLIIFSGLQQGFIFSDFNKAYVTCSLGIHYVGYCMITMGVCNILSAVLIAISARLIPREAVLGFGGIMHIGIMVGFLVWIPDQGLVMFLVLAAAWGVCDAVWLTQCNSLICLTCPENTDVAFANSRLLQSLGLFVSFVSGTFICVAGKLYMLITMLVLSILFYVMAEYRVRHTEDDASQGEVTSGNEPS